MKVTLVVAYPDFCCAVTFCQHDHLYFMEFVLNKPEQNRPLYLLNKICVTNQTKV